MILRRLLNIAAFLIGSFLISDVSAAGLSASPLDQTPADSSLSHLRQVVFARSFQATPLPGSSTTLDNGTPDLSDGTPATVHDSRVWSGHALLSCHVLNASREVLPSDHLYCLFCTFLI